MTDLDLARALVAAPWWPYRMPGGQLRDEAGIMWRPARALAGEPLPLPDEAYDDLLPDLADPATAGVLLDMISEEQSGLQVLEESDEEGDRLGWIIRTPLRWGSRVAGEGPTLGEAAARALLATRRTT